MVSLSPKIILLVKNRALGDSIMGLASLKYVRSLYPDAQIIYGVPKWVGPLYDKCQTDADEILPLDFSSLFSWWKLWWTLKKKSIDLIYEMHLSGRSKKFFDLYASFNAIPYYFHNHHLGIQNNSSISDGHNVIYDQGIIKPLIQRDLDGIWSSLSPHSPSPSFRTFKPFLDCPSSKKNNQTIILGVLATRQTKMWPLPFFIQLAKLIKKQTSFEVIIPLSHNLSDQKIKKYLKNNGLPPSCRILEVPLNQLPEALCGSHSYIGNDTGLKHLAISLGIKTYTFFGPEPPLEWHPYDIKKHPFFYLHPLECRTEKAHYCGLNECDSMICLKEFSPEFIFKSIFSTF